MNLPEISLKNQYNALSKTSSIAGAAGTRFLLKKGWKFITKKEPPINPASPGVLWKEALLWGAATGLAAGVARIVLRRITAGLWRKYKGAKPTEA